MYQLLYLPQSTLHGCKLESANLTVHAEAGFKVRPHKWCCVDLKCEDSREGSHEAFSASTILVKVDKAMSFAAAVSNRPQEPTNTAKLDSRRLAKDLL